MTKRLSRKRITDTMLAMTQGRGGGTGRELAQATGYSPDHLRLLARQGRCGAQKHGGRWWMHRASLEVYANQRARHGRRGARD